MLGGGGHQPSTGPVSIAARGSIVVADGGNLTANSTVNLKAPYVELGQPFVQPGLANTFTTAPVYGPGRLSVTAQFIDIGNLALQNIGQATFTAINGDIRGDGTLDVAGNIVMQAGQIYPATGVTFTIASSDYTVGGVTQPGSVTILPGGVRQLPLSAAGTLDITGSIINQVRARYARPGCRDQPRNVYDQHQVNLLLRQRDLRAFGHRSHLRPGRDHPLRH